MYNTYFIYFIILRSVDLYLKKGNSLRSLFNVIFYNLRERSIQIYSILGFSNFGI